LTTNNYSAIELRITRFIYPKYSLIFKEQHALSR